MRLGIASALCFAAIAAASCASEEPIQCGPLICPIGLACHPTETQCVTEEALSQCADSADGSECQVSEIDGVCLDSVCVSVRCGDAIVMPPEACDDGNNVSGDGCSADCASDESCGNEIVDTDVGETCDDGNNNDGDGCSAGCALE